MKFLSFAPCLYISAKTGLRVSKIMGEVEKITPARQRRIPTPELNQFIQRIEPGGKEGTLRIQYMVQAGVKPPHFILFTNRKSRMPTNYLRFISNQIHETFDFYGTPLVVSVKTKKGRQTTA
jgi:GTP-binding protein